MRAKVADATRTALLVWLLISGTPVRADGDPAVDLYLSENIGPPVHELVEGPALTPSWTGLDGGVWVRGTVPDGHANAATALQGSHAEVGARMHELQTPGGVALNLMPQLHVTSPTRPGGPHTAAGIGQQVLLPLPGGLHLMVEAEVGDPGALGLAIPHDPNDRSRLAGRMSGHLSTDLPVPDDGAALHFGADCAGNPGSDGRGFRVEFHEDF